MDGTLFAILSIIIVFLMEVLGASLVYCLKKEVSGIVNTIIFGVSAGVMLASVFFSLLLPSIEKAKNNWGKSGFLWITVAFLLGTALMLATDFVICNKEKSQSAQAKKLFFSMALHNIPEGLALGFAFGAAFSNAIATPYVAILGLAIGIGFQNIPEGAAVALPLKAVYHNSHKAFLYALACAAVEPICGIIGYFCASMLYSLQTWLLAFAAGAILFVTIEELLPMSKEQENGVAWGTIAVICGFWVMAIMEYCIY